MLLSCFAVGFAFSVPNNTYLHERSESAGRLVGGSPTIFELERGEVAHRVHGMRNSSSIDKQNTLASSLLLVGSIVNEF